MERFRQWRFALVTLLATASVATACGKEPGMQPTENKEQATQTVDNILQETYQQLALGAELKPFGSVGELPCDDPTDGGPAGRIFIEKRYQLKFPHTWPTEQAIPTLAAYWQQHNYKIINDMRTETTPQRLAVERRDDGYRVIVEVWNRRSGATDVYLTGSSPCVWETGTPTPQ